MLSQAKEGYNVGLISQTRAISMCAHNCLSEVSALNSAPMVPLIVLRKRLL
jgi:hypothetical protein